MSSYTVVAGDTFALIARKEYGTEVEAIRIAQANPGVAEPLTAGTMVVIPAQPDAPQDTPQAAISDDEDEVAILIDGRRFRFWESVTITRAIDAMDTVEFVAPFDADAPDFRETFRPLTYKDMTITVGGEPLFTGTLVSPIPDLQDDRKVLNVSGYSLPGVLSDCTPPASAFPLEVDGQNLKDIATALAAPFGIAVQFDADPGDVFERVAQDPSGKVLAFLIKLAKQRKLIISSTPRGALLFPAPTPTGSPVARLSQGASPVTSVTPFLDPRNYYSHVTGLEPVLLGLAGTLFTVKNARLAGIVRPFTFKTPDTIDANVKDATEAKAGRMFGSVASYLVPVSTWRDPQGELWAPGTTLTLIAPDAMIYTEFEFEVRSVQFDADSTSRTAVLDLVIPGAFAGKIPEVLPWDD